MTEPASAPGPRDRGPNESALERELETMRQALVSRAVIEQAKGILAAVGGWTVTETWWRMIRMSQHHNVKVRQLSELVVSQTAGAAGTGSDPTLASALRRELALPCPPPPRGVVDRV